MSFIQKQYAYCTKPCGFHLIYLPDITCHQSFLANSALNIMLIIET